MRHVPQMNIFSISWFLIWGTNAVYYI